MKGVTSTVFVFAVWSLLLCTISTRRVQRGCFCTSVEVGETRAWARVSLRNALLFKLLFNSTGEQSSS